MDQAAGCIEPALHRVVGVFAICPAGRLPGQRGLRAMMRPLHPGTSKHSLSSGRSALHPRGVVPRQAQPGPLPADKPHEGAARTASTMRTTHRPTGSDGGRRARRVTHGLNEAQRRIRRAAGQFEQGLATRTLAIGTVSVPVLTWWGHLRAGVAMAELDPPTHSTSRTLANLDRSSTTPLVRTPPSTVSRTATS